MNVLYVIWVIVISATDGHVIDERAGSQAMTLEDCNRALIEKGPIKAQDGKAVVAVCRKITGDVSL